MEHFLLFSIVSTAITLLSIFAASTGQQKSNESSSLEVTEEEGEKEVEVKEATAKFMTPVSTKQPIYLPLGRLAFSVPEGTAKILSSRSTKYRHLSIV